jgi:hypothetical protein
MLLSWCSYLATVWMTRQSNPCKGDLSLLRNVHTTSVAQPAPRSKDTGALALTMKWPGRKPYHSPSPSDEVKNECSYKTTSPIHLNGKHRDNFTFTCLYVPSIPRHSKWFFFQDFWPSFTCVLFDLPIPQSLILASQKYFVIKAIMKLS